jgi:hypothetical protein
MHMTSCLTMNIMYNMYNTSALLSMQVLIYKKSTKITIKKNQLTLFYFIQDKVLHVFCTVADTTEWGAVKPD